MSPLPTTLSFFFDMSKTPLREEDIDSVPELLRIINDIRHENHELREILISGNANRTKKIMEAIGSLQQGMGLLLVGSLAAYLFSILPAERKEGLAEKALQYLVLAAAGAGGVYQVFGQNNASKPGDSRHPELDSRGTMGQRRQDLEDTLVLPEPRKE
jgi:hypothetical protein